MHEEVVDSICRAFENESEMKAQLAQLTAGDVTTLQSQDKLRFHVVEADYMTDSQFKLAFVEARSSQGG